MKFLKIIFLIFISFDVFGAPSEEALKYAQEKMGLFTKINTIKKQEVMENLASFVDIVNSKESDVSVKPFIKNLKEFTIPEILYCNYELRNSNKLYYYPIVRDQGVFEKSKGKIRLGLLQKIAFSKKGSDIDDKIDQKDFAANLISFITVMLYNSDFQNWDQFIYNVSCISGAINFYEKGYDHGAKVNFDIAREGILKQITNKNYSCLSLTNFVMFMVDNFFHGREQMKLTINSGNSEHSFIRTYSEVFEGLKIFIDPFTIFNQFRGLREEYLEHPEEYAFGYSKMLKKFFDAPGIAYSANSKNFRGVFYQEQGAKVSCKDSPILKLTYGKPKPEIIVPQNIDKKNCEGQMYSLGWTNAKSKKYQSKIFALFGVNEMLEPFAIPNGKSSSYRVAVLLGGLDISLEDWFKEFFQESDRLQAANFVIKKIDNFKQFQQELVGDYSEYYKSETSPKTRR